MSVDRGEPWANDEVTVLRICWKLWILSPEKYAFNCICKFGMQSQEGHKLKKHSLISVANNQINIQNITCSPEAPPWVLFWSLTTLKGNQYPNFYETRLILSVFEGNINKIIYYEKK